MSSTSGRPFPKTSCLLCFTSLVIGAGGRAPGEELGPLAVGVAGHAFDHLGGIVDQAETAAASGLNIVYATGFGSVGSGGLPAAAQMKELATTYSAYVRRAKAGGIKIALGYVCATSIVKLDAFDRHWPAEFRGRFSSPPAKWLQLDRDGKPLSSWYGGDYRPACMNHPDWRAYEKFIVGRQLDCGHDGIFFDNPTVHPEGCYCEHCMKKFERFLAGEGTKVDSPAGGSVEFLRRLAGERPKDFMRFRCTIAADFLGEMREYARSIKPAALITCNNSLNSPEAFFSQCRTFAYDIHEMSKVEDLVVVEDMATQPRVLAGGKVVEYGPVYELLVSISHGKPLVVTTLAEGDYHTPPNLMRLAMAEAAAHGASYLSWPTWPENMRRKMVDGVRPQADFLREHAELLNGVTNRTDAYLFLPFRRWAETADCHALMAARALSGANVQFRVVCEDELEKALASGAPPVLILESESVLSEAERGVVEKYKFGGGRVVWSGRENWLAELRQVVERPAVEMVDAPPTVRAIVREKSNKTIVHLLNLNVQRVSSFEDRVSPVSQLRLRIRCRSDRVASVKALSADAEGTRGAIGFTTRPDQDFTIVEVTVPRVFVSTILLIE
jgi:hypothetical protein